MIDILKHMRELPEERQEFRFLTVGSREEWAEAERQVNEFATQGYRLRDIYQSRAPESYYLLIVERQIEVPEPEHTGFTMPEVVIP